MARREVTVPDLGEFKNVEIVELLVKAGDQVPLTLTFASGLSLEITAVGKDFTGAEESYNPSPSMSGM